MKYSTSTLNGNGETVPRLAATGALAYSPESPPERDYFFQYSWVIPEVLAPDTNRRRHFWFGDSRRESPHVEMLFQFWNKARRGEVELLYTANGVAGRGKKVTGPLAAYRHDDAGRDRLILMQHGSYSIVKLEDQPYLDRGEALLYRGIGKAKAFRLHRLRDGTVHEKVLDIHARTLTDSVVSFNAVHSNLARTETEYLNDRGVLFRLCAGGVVRCEQVWAEPREIPHTAGEHPDHDIRRRRGGSESD